jgi:hypothetical protein
MLTYRPAQGGSIVDAVISIINNSGAWFSYARATAFIGERHEGNHIFANYISQWRPSPVAETVRAVLHKQVGKRPAQTSQENYLQMIWHHHSWKHCGTTHDK